MKINRNELVKIAGYLGAGLLVAGYGRYLIHSVWTKWEIGMVSAGAVLLLISLAANFRQIIDAFRGRSARLGANTVILSAAVIALFAIVNFLGYRHHKRIDLTAEKLYSLSDQTRKIVSGLQKDIKIIKFDEKDDQSLKDQMTEYRDLSNRLTYEQVDPRVKPEIAKQYQVSRMGEVVVASGSRIERPQGTSEQELTNAILKVTRDTLKTICFIEGHDEKAISNSEAKAIRRSRAFSRMKTTT